MRIGIDLGGTKIEGILLANTGDERARLRVATPRSYAETVDAIVGLIRSLEGTADATPGMASIGIGIPGAVVPTTGLVKNANSTWLIGQPLGHDLESQIGRPVRLANDANCFALSESVDGAASEGDVVFGVILGTGVGGGIVVRGEVLNGINLIAGEWGHNPLPWPSDDERPGPRCYCGRLGCIESWLSGPAFEQDFARATGTQLAARDIIGLANHGDAHATAALHRYHERLARALSSIINVLDPDVIVLGGGMSNTPLLAEATTALLRGWVFSDEIKTRIVRNTHGDSSGVRGAAWLWPLDLHV